MRTASRFVIVIILLGVVLGGIFGYKFYQFGQMQEQMSQPQPPAKISAVTAQTESWTPQIKAVGSIEAINGIEVANEVPGVVVGDSSPSPPRQPDRKPPAPATTPFRNSRRSSASPAFGCSASHIVHFVEAAPVKSQHSTGRTGRVPRGRANRRFAGYGKSPISLDLPPSGSLPLSSPRTSASSGGETL